jgi:hypothetical protein
VTSSPLATFELDPSAFFDGQAKFNGLQLRAKSIDRVSMEDTEILKFIRTPEGKGVAVLRSSGGEIWRFTERGSTMIRMGSWSSGDFVVVLRGGKSIHTH